MQFNYKKLLKKSISLAIIIIAIAYIYSIRDNFSALANISPVTLILLVVYGIIPFLFVALTFKHSIKLFDVSLKFKEWFGLSVANTMYNYFVPARGGLVARAFYLKKKYGLEYSKYASLLGGTFLINFLVASFSALLLNAINLIVNDVFFRDIFWVSLILFSGTLSISLLLWFYPQLLIKTGWTRLDNFLKSILEGLKYFKSNYKILGLIALTQVGVIVFMGLRLYFSFLVLDIQIDLLFILIVQSLIVFSMVLSLTPGNLGIKEGIIGLLASMMDIPLKDTIMAAALDRAIAMIVVFSIGTIFHFILSKEKQLVSEKTQ
jgi:hypothetical protein